MNQIHIDALRYIKNTEGGATKENFIEDHEPIGEILWYELHTEGLIMFDEQAALVLTELGKEALK